MFRVILRRLIRAEPTCRGATLLVLLFLATFLWILRHPGAVLTSEGVLRVILASFGAEPTRRGATLLVPLFLATFLWILSHPGAVLTS